MKIVLVSKCSLDITQYVEFKISVLISPSKSLISSYWVTYVWLKNTQKPMKTRSRLVHNFCYCKFNHVIYSQVTMVLPAIIEWSRHILLIIKNLTSGWWLFVLFLKTFQKWNTREMWKKMHKGDHCIYTHICFNVFLQWVFCLASHNKEMPIKKAYSIYFESPKPT